MFGVPPNYGLEPDRAVATTRQIAPREWGVPRNVIGFVRLSYPPSRDLALPTWYKTRALPKNKDADGIEEQQNMQVVIRKFFKKTKARRVGGDHYEGSAKLGGNRDGVIAHKSGMV